MSTRTPQSETWASFVGRTREALLNWKRWGWSLSGILCLPTKPLDAVAAAAYGWAAAASDGDVLRESLALNGGARCASCDAVRSVDHFGGPVDSRVKSGIDEGMMAEALTVSYLL